MILRAPWGVGASDLVPQPVGHPSAQTLTRFVVREHGPAMWIVLWAATLAAEFYALRPVVFETDAPIVGLDVVFSLVGGSFAAFGLVAWRRRPDSRSGMLMTATGFAFFVSPLLSQVDGEFAATALNLLVDSWIFFFVALLLTLLTSGRLQPGLDRWLVAAYAFPLVLLQIPWMMFSAEDGHLLLAFPDEQVAHVLDRAQRGLLVGICLLTVVVIAARWWATSGPRRRALLPSVAGALCLLLFAALLVNDLVAGTRSQALLWLAACSLVTVPAAFLAGLLRSRLARGGLAELFLGLGTTRGGDLQAALVKALGDPGLVVAYRVPGQQAYVDADGARVPLPARGSDRSVAPIERDGREIAALVYDATLDDDPELVEAVHAAATIALEHAHLHAESQSQLAELQASRQRIVAAGDSERRRLERDLHDGAQQRLVALALQLRLIQADIRRDPATAERMVTSASDELAHSLQELRELARGIHPATLDHGLAAALDSLASRSTVATAVSCEADERLPRLVELAVYFVACEALANVGKYSHATAASVRLSRTADGVAIEIADDGVGGAEAAGGSGLRGLADRVEALDGHLLVTSPHGAGTVITAELPCAS